MIRRLLRWLRGRSIEVRVVGPVDVTYVPRAPRPDLGGKQSVNVITADALVPAFAATELTGWAALIDGVWTPCWRPEGGLK